MVNIYLNIDGSPLSLLTIPNSEAERLSIHPFKWIRYVMFTICGASGDLSSSPAPDGPSVDYDSTSLPNDIDLYYNPSGICIFVDYNCFVERATTTDGTPRRHNFRDEVIKRDGESCIITGESADICDAAHILPRCKTDEYLSKVVEDCWDLYDPRPPPIDGVNDIQNGVLLKADLHRLLSKGSVALLKTPNYGLDPTDIRRFERGPTDTAHITLHRLKKPDSDDPVGLEVLTHSGTLHPLTAFGMGAHVDALFNGTDRSLLHLPHDIVLDYMLIMHVAVSPSPAHDSPRDYTPTADIPFVESANTPEDPWWDWQAEEDPRVQDRVWATIAALEDTVRTGRLVLKYGRHVTLARGLPRLVQKSPDELVPGLV
ncbi:hypothetical protein EDB85DRAFT_2241270 [Lactarius pseudohatsudake]|nr:hypothetical protein EDB85DRAFT_2241270 [Lactarius pseudohatsudake]